MIGFLNSPLVVQVRTGAHPALGKWMVCVGFWSGRGWPGDTQTLGVPGWKVSQAHIFPRGGMSGGTGWSQSRGSCFCTAESSEPLQVLPGYRREASQKRELGLMVKRSDERRVQNLWKTSGEVLGKTGSQNCGAGNGGKNCNKLDFCLFLFGHRVRKEAK